MARGCCLTILALALVLAWAPGQAPAKKRTAATAKRCTVKKAVRPRACRARSFSAWQLLREPRSRSGLIDLTPSAALPGATAPGPTGPTGGGPAPVYSRFASIRATEYAFVLSRPVVGAGRVTVQLQNFGEDPHNLKVSTGPGQAPLTSIPDQDPGQVAQTSPTLGAGTYYLYCSLGDHESRGMHASLEVR
jgi:plastocyanin